MKCKWRLDHTKAWAWHTRLVSVKWSDNSPGCSPLCTSPGCCRVGDSGQRKSRPTQTGYLITFPPKPVFVLNYRGQGRLWCLFATPCVCACAPVRQEAGSREGRLEGVQWCYWHPREGRISRLANRLLSTPWNSSTCKSSVGIHTADWNARAVQAMHVVPRTLRTIQRWQDCLETKRQTHGSSSSSHLSYL